MDIRKIKKMIELLEESGIAEIEIREGEATLRIARVVPGQSPYLAAPPAAVPAPAAPRPAAAPPPPAPPPVRAAVAAPVANGEGGEGGGAASGHHIVTAPMV